VLAAHRLAAGGRAIHSVYTFGQPRAGDGAFAAAYNGGSATWDDRLEACPTLGSRTFRVVNQNDIVARVPGVLYGYRHHAQFVLIGASGQIQIAPSLAALLVSDALGLWAPLRRLGTVKLASWQWVYEAAEAVEVLGRDHFIGQYEAALAGAGNGKI
jgi:hypothetical protein